MTIYRETVSQDFATAPFWISLYMRKMSFLSVCIFTMYTVSCVENITGLADVLYGLNRPTLSEETTDLLYDIPPAVFAID